MKMRKLILCVLLSGCATTGIARQDNRTFEQKYNDGVEKVRVCMQDTIYAVLGFAVKGPEIFVGLCETKKGGS
jgi:hypothetical protein